ncbi:MAG TPA: isochorismatase family cysteine hydrolase [Candidatus Tectomicrobia bacterium]
MAEPLRLAPTTCAFIIIDIVNAITKGQGPPYTTPPHREALVQNYVRLVAHCRRVGTPLIYTVIHRHPDNRDAPKTLADAGPAGGAPMLAGTPAAEIIEDIRPQPQDWVIMKPRFSAFYGTNLDTILAALGTETLLVGGISTQRSVEGTARDAKNRDLQCIVVSDCCTAGELDVHDLTIQHVLPLLVRVRTTDEVIAALQP